MLKLKKIIAIISILSIAIAPVQAALNTQNMVGSTLASAGFLSAFMLAGAGLITLPVTASLAVGALGLTLLMSNNEQTPTPQNAPIQIQLNPNQPLVTPPGWTAPVAPSKQPQPPSTKPASTNYLLNGSYTYTGLTTPTQACQKYTSEQITRSGGTSYMEYISNTATSCNYKQYAANGTLQGDFSTGTGASIATTYVCESGYSVSGTNCNLSSAAAVKKPVMGIMQVVRTGNQYSIDPQINPSDILPNSIANVTGTKVTVIDQSGNTTTTTINSDGTTTVEISKALPDNKNSKTTINYSAPDGSGNTYITGKNQSEGSGSGTAANSTPSTTTSGNGTGTSIDISSLNKESTQTQIRDLLKCDNCELPADVSEQNQTKINDEIKKSTGMLEKVNEDYAGFKDLGWSNWVPTFPSSTCSPINGLIAGQYVSWDFCPHIAKLNELLGWLMNLFGAWTITGMFFKRE